MPVFCYILAILLLLILLILFLPVFCRIIYREKLTVYLEILCFRFRLYPERAKKTRNLKKKAKKKTSVPHPQKSASPFSQIGLILSIAKEQYPHVLSAATLRLKRLRMTIGGEDAAKTALLYGEASLALSAFLELLHGFCKFSEDKGAVSLTPDFLNEGTSLDAVLLLHTNLFRVISLGLRLSFAFVKKKTERQRKTQQSNIKK